jgi:hypothetical protein
MIRIEGKNLADEGFSGANARDMDTGRMSKEAALFLTETIKKAIAPINNAVKTNKVVIAQTASNMAKIIEQNTKEFQTIIQDSGEDTQQELLKLLSMMNDAQKKTGDASVAAMKAVVQQIENLKRSDTTGKLSPLLDLDKRQKEIVKPLGRQTVFGAAFKKFTNVDLRRESALQALTPTKLFGLDPGTSDIIKDTQTNAATSGVTGAMKSLVGALTPNSDVSSQRAAGALSKITATDASSQRAAKITTPDVNAQGGTVYTTGIDRESLDNKKVELLEQILAQLKEIESSSGSGKSFFALGGVIPKLLTAIPLLASAAMMFKDLADIISGGGDQGDVGGVAGSITGTVLGGVLGFLLGGPPGAMIGAGLGGIAGNIVGNLIGDNQEARDAEALEKYLANPANTEGKTEQEIREDVAISRGKPDAFIAVHARRGGDQRKNLKAAEESGLYEKRGMFRDSYVSLHELNRTTDREQLKAILEDDDLNENYRMKVEERLQSIPLPTSKAMENFVDAYNSERDGAFNQYNIDNSTTVTQGSSGSPNYVTQSTGARPNSNISELLIG